MPRQSKQGESQQSVPKTDWAQKPSRVTVGSTSNASQGIHARTQGPSTSISETIRPRAAHGQPHQQGSAYQSSAGPNSQLPNPQNQRQLSSEQQYPPGYQSYSQPLQSAVSYPSSRGYQMPLEFSGRSDMPFSAESTRPPYPPDPLHRGSGSEQNRDYTPRPLEYYAHAQYAEAGPSRFGAQDAVVSQHHFSSHAGTPRSTTGTSHSPVSTAPVTPSATGSGLPARAPDPGMSPMTRQKYSLYIRQQPRAARAGPDGRDRRPIDPPVVLQLQILDFDPRSEDHIRHLRNPFWVVHCYLFSAESPGQNLSVIDEGPSRSGANGIRKLLIGQHVTSPLFAPEDPDPATAVRHPSSLVSAMPSDDPNREGYRTQPGTFFIFSDLSIRMAGNYRLQFQLMRLEASASITGQTIPVLATTMSNPFNVSNAKNFDKVQESTALVRGLARLPGAPPTMKLKKGPGARDQRARQRRIAEEDQEDEEMEESD